MMRTDDFQNSPYFQTDPESVAIPVSDILARETPDPQRVASARQLMADARAGIGEKRKPIVVFRMHDGKYRVIDGNSTLQALRELQETTAMVIISPGCP